MTTHEQMGLVRMLDILQSKATRYAKNSLLKDVQAFLYNYDPSWTTTMVEKTLLDYAINIGWLSVVRVGSTDYAKLSPEGFLARTAAFELLE